MPRHVQKLGKVTRLVYKLRWCLYEVRCVDSAVTSHD